MQHEPMKTYHDSKGFTLVELMIATMLATMIMAAVYVTYITNQRIQTAQSQVVEMQQNLRAGADMLTRDLRMAGFNPGGSAGAGFEHASRDAVSFSRDIDRDGDVNDAGEHIAYDIYTGANGQLNLGRAVSNAAIAMVEGPPGQFEATGHQPVAENIEAIEFNYMLEDGSTTTTPTNAQLSEIRSVQISILARSAFADPEYNGNVVYTPTSGTSFALGAAPAKGNFRRRMLVETVKFRNMGL
jgi:type IV pilus assembly protein PilW